MTAQEIPSVKLEKMKTSSNDTVPCCDCSMTLALNRFKIIPVYDGTTPFEPFKQEIDFIKKMIPPKAEKFFVAVIILKLTGAAFTAALNYEFRDIEELLSFLKMRFEPRTRPYLEIVSDIVQSRMNQNEEVKVYHDRISKLMKEAEEVLQNPSSRRDKKDINHREHLELLALQSFLKGIPQEWQTSLSYLRQSTFNEALIKVMNYEKELGIITKLRRDNEEQCLKHEKKLVSSNQESEVSIGKNTIKSKQKNNSRSNKNNFEHSQNSEEGSLRSDKNNKEHKNSKNDEINLVCSDQESKATTGRDNIESKQKNNSKSNQNDFEDSNNSEEGPFRSCKNKVRIISKKLKRRFGFFTIATSAGENLIRQEVLKSHVSIDHSKSFPLKSSRDAQPIITLGTVILYAFGEKIEFQVLPAGSSALEEDGVLGMPFMFNVVDLFNCNFITIRNQPDKQIPLYSIPLKKKGILIFTLQIVEPTLIILCIQLVR